MNIYSQKYKSLIENVIDESKELFINEAYDASVLNDLQEKWIEKFEAAANFTEIETQNPTVQPVSESQTNIQETYNPPLQMNLSANNYNYACNNSQIQINYQSNNSQQNINFPNQLRPVPFNFANAPVKIQPLDINNIPQHLVPLMMTPKTNTQMNNNRLPPPFYPTFPQTDGTIGSDDSDSDEFTNVEVTKPIETSPRKNQFLNSSYENDADNDDDDDDDEGDFIDVKSVRTPQVTEEIPEATPEENKSIENLSKIFTPINSMYEDEDEPDDSVIDEENMIEEEPLNSDDDLSENENELERNSENIILCQYDKVTHDRQKWKLVLSSLVCHFNGRDAVYHSAKGEPRW